MAIHLYVTFCEQIKKKEERKKERKKDRKKERKKQNASASGRGQSPV